MMTDQDFRLLQALLEVIIAVAVPVLTVAVRTWIMAHVNNVKANMTETQRAMVEALLGQLVDAAEQYNFTGQLKQSGAEKKRWVLEQAKTFMDSNGIKLDVDLLSSMVEAAVVNSWTAGKLKAGTEEG